MGVMHETATRPAGTQAGGRESSTMETWGKKAGMRRQQRPRGQSTVEYALVTAVVIVAVIAAATNWIGPAVEQTLDDAATVIDSASGKVGTGVGVWFE